MNAHHHADHIEACGIRGLVRAGEADGWFLGHLGAAFLSGAQLLREPALSDRAKGALAAALDRLESTSPEWYGPLGDDSPAPAKPDPLLDALSAHAQRLRTSGHGTIYTVAALRAFRRQPKLASERGVAAITRLHAAAQRDDASRYLGCDDYMAAERRLAAEASAPLEIDIAIRDGLRACEQRTPDILRDGQRYFLFGEKIHVLTHLHALVVLEELGQSELARNGLAAHRLQLTLSAVPAQELRPVPEPTSLHPGLPEFWEHDGDDVWHKLKLADASLGLLRRLAGDEQREARGVLGGMWAMLGVPSRQPG